MLLRNCKAGEMHLQYFIVFIGKPSRASGPVQFTPVLLVTGVKVWGVGLGTGAGGTVGPLPVAGLPEEERLVRMGRSPRVWTLHRPPWEFGLVD